MILKPITSEKSVKMVDLDNTLFFEADKRASKKEIKTEFELVFNVKVQTIRTLIRNNKKLAYIKLTKEYPAIDIATKLGMI